MQEGRTCRRLLLVEDNDETAHLLKAALEQLGYEVALAHNGPVALRLAQTFVPDVALLDIHLPVMDGWELAQRLRVQQGRPLHVIAITGVTDDAHRARSHDAGFAAHLIKPIDLEALCQTLQRLGC